MDVSLYNRLPVFLQNVVCSASGLNIRRQRYSRYFHRVLSWLEKTDKWPIERLHRYQNERLRCLVRHCYETVPFYRSRFDSLGIKPADIRSREDLKILPVLTKEVIRDNTRALVSTKYKLSSLTKMRTSGTTGAGLELYQQRETTCFQYAVWWRFRRRFGLHLHHKHALFGGRPVVPHSQRRPPFWRHNLGLTQTYFSSNHMTEENLPHYIDYLNRHEYVYYCGYPSVISILAEFMLGKGARIEKPPRVITTGSETLLPSQRRLIREAFGCPVVDQYGAAEQVCNMSQCEQGCYHEDMELGIIEREVIEEHADGVSARVIATGLVEEGMPLLRYDIGDVVTFVDGRCPCGRSAPIARYIDGRVEASILTPDGRRIGRMARVFADMLRVHESQIVQVSREALVVRVVRAPGYSPEDETRFERAIRAIVGDDMSIRFEYLPRVPREKNGKLRAVISQI